MKIIPSFRARLPNALQQPILPLEDIIVPKQAAVEHWFRREWHKTAPPFYASVDLRNAGFKLAPVDTNLFPGGFNNLNPKFNDIAIHALQTAVERICPTAADLLLIPENHTRNIFYLENIVNLKNLLELSGFNVRLGALKAENIGEITLPSGNKILLEKLFLENRNHKNYIKVENFRPCSVILNNDLSAGLPEILQNIAQPILPSANLGWNQRLKSEHFSFYRQVAQEFATELGFDSWLIDPLFAKCGAINFMAREGEDCLAKQVDLLLKNIQTKYDIYNIKKEPFVIIKADAGTYGMGIMTARSVDDVKELNKKQRKKMASAKEGRESTQVIIQEGVYTEEFFGEARAAAEPVVYMADRYVIGGFYRVNTGRGVDENLNAPGMQFESLAFNESCVMPDRNDPHSDDSRLYVYGVIARLALVAAAREIEAAH